MAGKKTQTTKRDRKPTAATTPSPVLPARAEGSLFDETMVGAHDVAAVQFVTPVQVGGRKHQGIQGARAWKDTGRLRVLLGPRMVEITEKGGAVTLIPFENVTAILP